MSRRLISAVVLAGAMFTGTVFAMSNNVISTFRGQLVISKDELQEGKTDKETISKIHAASLKELTGELHGDVMVWNFHYTAFLSKTGSNHLKLEFLTTDKDHRLSADKQLDSVDTKSGVLSGDITIDEDEGLAKGKTYDVELSNGSSIVAKTTLTMK